jgi:hypothetical protein
MGRRLIAHCATCQWLHEVEADACMLQSQNNMFQYFEIKILYTATTTIQHMPKEIRNEATRIRSHTKAYDVMYESTSYIPQSRRIKDTTIIKNDMKL